MADNTATNQSQQGHSASSAKQQPPPYESQQRTYSAPPYPNVNPYPASQSYSVFAYHEPVWLRFFRAFFIAVFVWLLFSMFVQSIVYVARWNHDKHHHSPSWPGYSIPAGIDVKECNHWEENLANGKVYAELEQSSATDPLLYSANTSFDLPIDSEDLFLVARGPYASGFVNIVTSPHQKSDSATVFVKVRYYREDILEAVRVCFVSREKDGSGVGIFTPDWFQHGGDRWGKRVSVEVNVVFPEPSGDAAPLLVKKFETDVHNTPIHVGRLSDKVHFNNLTVQSSNGHIAVDGLSANDTVIKTSNNGITGSFNSTKRIVLKTSNAPISVTVGLTNVWIPHFIPSLRAETSNGVLSAQISLFAKKKDKEDLTSERAAYYINTRTSNHGLDVKFNDAPVDSILEYEGITSNGIAVVFLHPTYEGTYSLRTSNSPATLIETKPDDPSGRGRHRRVSREKSGRSSLSGTIEWEDEDTDESDGKGSVEVYSSNRNVILHV